MTTFATTKSLEKPLKINELNALRAIFMFTIFLHHASLYVGAGYMAVSFFFMLSGFSLTLGYKDKILSGDFSYKDFAKRRISRLFPLHWLCILISLPLAVTGMTTIGDFVLTLILNASMLHSFVPISVFYFSFNWVSWFISAIFFFAMVFPYLLKVIVKLSMRWLVVSAIAVVCIYVVVLNLLPEDYYHPILYINPITRIVDFTIGVCLALLFQRNIGEHKFKKAFSPLKWDLMALLSFVVVIAISFLFPINNPYSVAILYWIPIGILIYSIAYRRVLLGGGFRVLDNKMLNSLGNMSFTFYMLHQLVMRWTQLVMIHVLHVDEYESLAYMFFVLIVTLVLSYLCNIYFEKPVAKWLTRK